MNRGQFLKDLGLSAQALMAFYCMGTVTACKEDENPAPGGTGGTGTGGNTGISGSTSGSAIHFTVDLTHAQFLKLKTPGQFAYVANIIIANAKGSLVALSKICTHEGGTVEFRATENDFVCTNHGSQFNLDGSVKLAPATSGIQVYTTALDSSGNVLSVKS